MRRRDSGVSGVPTLFTVPEVAELLRITAKAVYSMNDRGQIPGAFWIGRRLRFDAETVLEWLRQKSTPSRQGEQR